MPNGISVSISELLAEMPVAEKVSLRPKRAQTGALSGEHRSHMKLRGMEFSEIRQYQPGDDIRSIDWKQSAKTGKTFTKVFLEEKQGKIVFIGDLSSRLFFGTRQMLKSTLVAKTLAKIILVAQSQKDRTSGVLITAEGLKVYPAAAGKAHSTKIIADISKASIPKRTIGKDGGVNLAVALKKVMPELSGNAMLFVVSDFASFTEEFKTNLKIARARSDVFLMLIEDDFEVNPEAGVFNVKNGNVWGSLDLDNKSFFDAYKNFFFEKRKDISDFAMKNSMFFATLNTAEDDAKKFREMFFAKRVGEGK